MSRYDIETSCFGYLNGNTSPVTDVDANLLDFMENVIEDAWLDVDEFFEEPAEELEQRQQAHRRWIEEVAREYFEARKASDEADG